MNSNKYMNIFYTLKFTFTEVYNCVIQTYVHINAFYNIKHRIK